MLLYTDMRSATLHSLAHSGLRRFGKRLLISLLVLGLAYGGGVYLWRHQQTAVTPYQKLSVLRAGIDQTLVSGSRLSGFSDTNSIAGTNLSQEFAIFQTSVDDLKKQLLATPASQLTKEQGLAVQAIIDRQQRAITSYKTAYKALAQPLSYDPYTDLGSLNIDKDTSKLITRSRAAQKGLTSNTRGTVTASNEGLVAQAGQAPAEVATKPTQELLAENAGCFGSLADQVSAKQASASATRQRCLQAYPVLRAQIIRNILDLSFSQQYLQDTQRTALPLLKQLDVKLANK